MYGLRMVVSNLTLRVEEWFGDFMSVWSLVVLFCDENVSGCRCLACFLLRVAGMVVLIIGGFGVLLCC